MIRFGLIAPVRNLVFRARELKYFRMRSDLRIRFVCMMSVRNSEARIGAVHLSGLRYQKQTCLSWISLPILIKALYTNCVLVDTNQ